MINILKENPIVPVFYHPDFEVCKQVLNVSYHAGIRIFEFTNRGNNALEIFEKLVAYSSQEFPEMLMGAGTIKNRTQANAFIAVGARFIVSPFGKATVAELCNEKKVPYFPGCMTLKEIDEAMEWGCTVVKIFPGEVLGLQFIKALKGPMPEVAVMVTGGVNEENITDWFDVGVTAVGMGSQLYDSKLIADGNFDLLQQKIEKALRKIANR